MWKQLSKSKKALTLISCLTSGSQRDTSVEGAESFLLDYRVQRMSSVSVPRHLERVRERVLLCLQANLDNLHRIYHHDRSAGLVSARHFMNTDERIQLTQSHQLQDQLQEDLSIVPLAARVSRCDSPRKTI